MKAPQEIYHSIEQHTASITESFHEMMDGSQKTIATESYKRGYNDGAAELSDALLYISRWGNDKKAIYFGGSCGLENILKNHEPIFIIETARSEQKEKAEEAAEKKEEMKSQIREDLTSLCKLLEIPLTYVADEMQRMFDEGVN